MTPDTLLAVAILAVVVCLLAMALHGWWRSPHRHVRRPIHEVRRERKQLEGRR